MMSRASGYLCGVSELECIAPIKTVGSNSRKVHGSRSEAFACFRRAMEKRGYKRIGSREFRKEGEPVYVAAKRTKFGARLRAGKSETGKGKRLNRPFHEDAIIEGVPK